MAKYEIVITFEVGSDQAAIDFWRSVKEDIKVSPPEPINIIEIDLRDAEEQD